MKYKKEKDLIYYTKKLLIKIKYFSLLKNK